MVPERTPGSALLFVNFCAYRFANKSRQFARIAVLNAVQMDVNITGKTITLSRSRRVGALISAYRLPCLRLFYQWFASGNNRASADRLADKLRLLPFTTYCKGWREIFKYNVTRPDTFALFLI